MGEKIKKKRERENEETGGDYIASGKGSEGVTG